VNPTVNFRVARKPWRGRRMAVFRPATGAKRGTVPPFVEFHGWCGFWQDPGLL